MYWVSLNENSTVLQSSRIINFVLFFDLMGGCASQILHFNRFFVVFHLKVSRLASSTLVLYVRGYEVAPKFFAFQLYSECLRVCLSISSRLYSIINPWTYVGTFLLPKYPTEDPCNRSPLVLTYFHSLPLLQQRVVSKSSIFSFQYHYGVSYPSYFTTFQIVSEIWTRIVLLLPSTRRIVYLFN